jgi:hypothetical protein
MSTTQLISFGLLGVGGYYAYQYLNAKSQQASITDASSAPNFSTPGANAVAKNINTRANLDNENLLLIQAAALNNGIEIQNLQDATRGLTSWEAEAVANSVQNVGRPPNLSGTIKIDLPNYHQQVLDFQQAHPDEYAQWHAQILAARGIKE